MISFHQNLKQSMNECNVCQRIELIAQNKNQNFILELQTGYVVLADNQDYSGYTIFICKIHAHELHELSDNFRTDFLREMSLVSEAVFKCFQPKKLNYELLGNLDPHLHWHIIPRRETDKNPQKSIWSTSVSTNNHILTPEQRKISVEKMRVELLKLVIGIQINNSPK